VARKSGITRTFCRYSSPLRASSPLSIPTASASAGTPASSRSVRRWLCAAAAMGGGALHAAVAAAAALPAPAPAKCAPTARRKCAEDSDEQSQEPGQGGRRWQRRAGACSRAVAACRRRKRAAPSAAERWAARAPLRALRAECAGRAALHARLTRCTRCAANPSRAALLLAGSQLKQNEASLTLKVRTPYCARRRGCRAQRVPARSLGCMRLLWSLRARLAALRAQRGVARAGCRARAAAG
jgi:hypothetical protein